MSENEKSTGESKAGENLLGNLSLGVVFRHFVSGAVFVASFLYAKGSLSRWSDMDEISKRSVLLGVLSLICGALIYAVHRAFVNPWCERFRHWLLPIGKRQRLRDCLMPLPVLEMMRARWKHCNSVKPEAAHVYEWGDYVHLLYTAGLATWFGSIAARIFVNSANWDWNGKIIALGFLFVLSGIYTDCRKHIVEQHCYNLKPKSES